MAIYTHYQEAEPDFPGAKAKIFTFPDPDHLDAMRASVESAKREADVVIVSFHWGLPFEPASLARYETDLARTCIDSGADLIIGHHQHLIKAVQVYKGKVIFHGINHFVIWIDYMGEHWESPGAKALKESYGDKYHNMDTKARNPFVAEANQCMIVRAELGRQGAQNVGFIPCVIDAMDATPRRTYPGDGDFERVLEYVEGVTVRAGFGTQFAVVDDYVQVLGT